MIHTAVEAPGEAPSMATMERSAALTSSVPNCSMPPCVGSFLMICTRCPATSTFQSSSFALGKNSRSVANRSFEDSRTWPIRYFESEVIPADSQQRQQIFRIDGAEEIEIRTVLEKLCRKARIRPEEQRNFSFDVPCVEMRHGCPACGDLLRLGGRRQSRSSWVFLPRC